MNVLMPELRLDSYARMLGKRLYGHYLHRSNFVFYLEIPCDRIEAGAYHATPIYGGGLRRDALALVTTTEAPTAEFGLYGCGEALPPDRTCLYFLLVMIAEQPRVAAICGDAPQPRLIAPPHTFSPHAREQMCYRLRVSPEAIGEDELHHLTISAEPAAPELASRCDPKPPGDVLWTARLFNHEVRLYCTPGGHVMTATVR